MKPSELQNALKNRLESLLADFPLLNSKNSSINFNIYKQNVPKRMANEYDYLEEDEQKENSDFPFVVVKMINGGKPGNFDMQTIKFQLIIGVHNEGLNGEGYDDLINAMELILDDFDKAPRINQKALLDDEVDFGIHDEDTYPHYFAMIECGWKLNRLNRASIGGDLYGRV